MKRILPGLQIQRRSNLLGIAVLLLAFALIWQAQVKSNNNSIAVKKESSIVAEFDTVKVPVPAETVPAGTKVSLINFEYVDYPKHQIPLGSITDINEIKDSITAVALPAKVPLFKENLYSGSNAINPLVDRIPEGMRAITLKVDATSAVEGWARSGSVVDVLLVEEDRTMVVAEQVKILSAERSMEPVNDSITPEVPSTVTVLVTQEQALAITTAIPRGRIAFALRSLKDESTWSNKVYTAEKLKNRGGVIAKNSVQGFISVGKGESKKAYALSNGKWIKTETVPKGYFGSNESSYE